MLNEAQDPLGVWSRAQFGPYMPKNDSVPEPFDVVSFIMDYEAGEITEERMIEGFQHLINTGLAWTLQGSYGRAATALIEAGYCHRREV